MVHTFAGLRRGRNGGSCAKLLSRSSCRGKPRSVPKSGERSAFVAGFGAAALPSASSPPFSAAGGSDDNGAGGRAASSGSGMGARLATDGGGHWEGDSGPLHPP